MTFIHAALFFATLIVFASPSRAELIHERREWHLLLHYKKSIKGNWQSEAKTPGFFVSRDGQSDPEAEFKALRESLEDLISHSASGQQATAQDSDPDRHPRCLFPARSEWLAKQLQLRLPDESTCPKLAAWKERVGARSVTFVFSSYFINNPSSAFGHTFLRLNRQDLRQLRSRSSDSEGRQLLDYGANYGMAPTTQNPLVYGVAAFTGFFPGRFTAMPYYYKVREYNDFEARDLWEYDLNLSADDVNQLSNHLWELGQTEFDYYYLGANCGYQVLSLLEASVPRFQLAEKLRPWVIPSDTAKIVERSGMIESLRYRPSIRTQFEWRKKRLQSKEENSSFRALVGATKQNTFKSEALEGLDAQGRARVLDAFMDYLDFSFAQEILLQEGPAGKMKGMVLRERSRLPIAEALQIPSPHAEAPSAGHDSGRLKLGLLLDSSESGGSDPAESRRIEVAYRGALHDLEDWPASYPEFSRIEMGNLRGRFDLAAGGASLEEFAVVGIEALHPFKFNDSLAAEPAWRFDLGLLRDSDQACRRCMRIRGEGGFGYSVLPSPQSLFFGYALINLASSPEFAGDKILPGIGGVIGCLFGVSRPWVVRIQAQSHQYWFGPHVFEKKEWMLRTRWRRDLAWAFEFSMQGSSAVKELELALYHYF